MRCPKGNQLTILAFCIEEYNNQHQSKSINIFIFFFIFLSYSPSSSPLSSLHFLFINLRKCIPFTSYLFPEIQSFAFECKGFRTITSMIHANLKEIKKNIVLPIYLFDTLFDLFVIHKNKERKKLALQNRETDRKKQRSKMKGASLWRNALLIQLLLCVGLTLFRLFFVLYLYRTPKKNSTNHLGFPRAKNTITHTNSNYESTSISHYCTFPPKSIFFFWPCLVFAFSS